MLRRRSKKGTNQVLVTFVLPGDDPRLPATVVGEFNGWDPAAHPMRRRSNGTWSASATLEKNSRYRFRYRGEDGTWFNDDSADGHVPNGYGSTDCVIST